MSELKREQGREGGVEGPKELDLPLVDSLPTHLHLQQLGLDQAQAVPHELHLVSPLMLVTGVQVSGPSSAFLGH